MVPPPKKLKLADEPPRRSNRLKPSVGAVKPADSKRKPILHESFSNSTLTTVVPSFGHPSHERTAEDELHELLLIKDNLGEAQVQQLENITDWLDDLVVFELLKRRVVVNNHNFIVVDPVVWNKHYKKPTFWNDAKRDEGVRLPTFPVFNENWETALVPAHVNGNHWILAIVYRNPAKIVVYDSLRKPLSAATKVKITDIGLLLTGQHVNPTPIARQHCPIQTDSYSCGAIICMIAEKISDGGSTFFKNETVYDWRRNAARFLQSQIGDPTHTALGNNGTLPIPALADPSTEAPGDAPGDNGIPLTSKNEGPILRPYQLNTSNDSESLEETCAEPVKQTRRTRGKKGEETEVLYFSTDQEFTKIKKAHSLSSKGQKRQTKTGVKQDFVCLRKDSHGCMVRATANFDGAESTLIVRHEHSHTGKVTTTVGVSEEVRQLVTERLDANESVAALVIRKVLRNRGVPEDKISNIKAISNYTCHQKKRRYGSVITGDDFLNEVKKHIINNDDDENIVGVVISEIILVEDEPEFCVIMTSGKLLHKFRSQKHIGLDATYKLLFNMYPVIIVGFSDEVHSFHPCAVAIVSTENTALYEKVMEFLCDGQEFREVVADGAMCITNASRKVLPDAFTRMCVFHLEQRLHYQMNHKGLSKTEQKMVREDVDLWKKTTSLKTAEAVKRHVMAKWNAIETVLQWKKYFDVEWVQKRKNWFNMEGGGPVTNNGNESSNNTVKKSYTFRRQGSMPETMKHLKDYLSEFQTHDIKKYVPKPKEFLAARELYEEGRDLITLQDTGKVVIPMSTCSLTQEEASQAIQNYFSPNPDYENVKTFLDNFHYVSRSQLFERRFWCSCYIYRTKHSCKHSLLIEINNKFRQWPDDIKIRTAQIGMQRGKGRGRLATSALEK
uniref:ULP_PROTEASE domain-containing protein n=1 Tax=Panagrellus redivivus TaxID=6233 RepID=A0A7E4ULX3_PANRE